MVVIEEVDDEKGSDTDEDEQAVEEEAPEDGDGADGDEDDDEDGGSGEMVGWLEEPPTEKERLLLGRRMFPSKVGGRPAWLVPAHLPELSCSSCARPLRFLLQVYASQGELRPSAFHRVLHLFVCTSCQPNRFRVFRAQMPRENSFYSAEAPDRKKVVKTRGKDAELEALCCDRCGLLRTPAPDGPTCAECERRIRNSDGPALFEERELTCIQAEVPEEDEEEDLATAAGATETEAEVEDGSKPSSTQAADVAAAGTEVACAPSLEAAGKQAPKEAKAEATSSDAVLPSSAVAKAASASAEPASEASGDAAVRAFEMLAPALADADVVLAAAQKETKENSEIGPELAKKLREYRERVVADPETVTGATEQEAFDEWSKEEGEKDEFFTRFQRYSIANAGHVLRYALSSEPQWFCTPDRLTQTPPPCSVCGAARIFEFQVQPQLIAELCESRSSDHALARRLDFGVVCVYVCGAHCDAPEDAPYIEEFVYVQPEPVEGWLPKAA